MNVRFIDTSVLVNKLEVPGMCNEAERVNEEFKKAVESEELLQKNLANISEKQPGEMRHGSLME